MRPDDVLIAGVRRFQACKQLGWTDVPVRIVDLDEIVRGSLAENSQRKDFLPTEIDAIRRALEAIEKAAARGRMSEGARVGKISTPSAAGRTRDKIGALATSWQSPLIPQRGRTDVLFFLRFSFSGIHFLF